MIFFIPGKVIALLTFPGIIVHEAAHMFFCKIKKVPIIEVKFFQFSSNMVGYVLHEDPKNFNTSFLISIGPFLINTLLCIIICFPAALPISFFDDFNFITIFLTWLGVSIGMNAFPSNQDAKIIWEKALEEIKKANPLAIISFPLVILIFIANALRFFWADTLYGIFIGIILPGFIFRNLF